MNDTLVYYNDRNSVPLSKEKILQAINKVIAEKELDAQNVTADNFSQTPVTPNTQRENENAILTSERLNNSDALAETLKCLTINNAGYYESDEKDKKAILQAIQRSHIIDKKKRKFTDTSNGNSQQKLLSNQNLLIITQQLKIGLRVGF